MVVYKTFRLKNLNEIMSSFYEADDVERLRAAVRGDGSMSWVAQFLPAETDRVLSASGGGESVGPFGRFPDEVASHMRRNPMVRGAHAILQSMELDGEPRDLEILVRELRIEGMFHNRERSKFESAREKRNVQVFSFAEISEVEELQALSVYDTDGAAVEKERELRDFRVSEMSAFLEDLIRLRVYIDEDEVVTSHFFGVT